MNNRIENQRAIPTFTVNRVPDIRGTYSPVGRQSIEVRSVGDLVRAGIEVPTQSVEQQFGPAEAAKYAEAMRKPHGFYRNNR